MIKTVTVVRYRRPVHDMRDRLTPVYSDVIDFTLTPLLMRLLCAFDGHQWLSQLYADPGDNPRLCRRCLRIEERPRA